MTTESQTETNSNTPDTGAGAGNSQDTSVNSSQDTSIAAAPETGKESSGEAGGKGSEAKGEASPKTALEAAKRATQRTHDTAKAEVKAREKGGESPNPEAGKSGPEKDKGGNEDLTGRIDDDEWAALPDKTRRRISQFRGQLKELKRDAAQNVPKVAAYDELATYISGAGMSRDDFTEALEIMRLVRSDPAAAYKRLEPILGQLREFVGEVLPQDLEQAVSDGTISREYAQQLAKERKRGEHLEAQGAREREAQERTALQSRVQEAQQQTETALRALEKQWRESDPDYLKKADQVWERMVLLMQTEGKPGSPEYILDVAKRAYADVNKRMTGFLPKPAPKTPVTAPGGSSNLAPQPKSAIEAARLALKGLSPAQA